MKRRTRQQDVIQDLFSEATQPMTAAQLFEKAMEVYPGIGQATVYRQIQQALDRGDIRQVELPGRSAHYELTGVAHRHFFICRGCQVMLPLAGCPGRLSELAPVGCQVVSHEIMLYGFCPTCCTQRAESSKFNLVV